MTRKEWHETAIKILEAVELAEKLHATKLENLNTAINLGILWYKTKCIENLKMSTRVQERLHARYNNHILSLKELEF